MKYLHKILDYKDSESKFNECSEKYATELYYDKKYTEAKAIYDEIKSRHKLKKVNVLIAGFQKKI